MASGVELNARLYDVFPDGTAVLVDRGVQRVSEPAGTLHYELHGNGWRFDAGHRIRIEIAQDDSPYLVVSSVPSSTSIGGVRLHVPVREGGSIGGGPETQPGGGAAAQCVVPELKKHKKKRGEEEARSGELHARQGQEEALLPGPEGKIIKQKPKPGTVLPAGSPVKLKVSAGPG